MPGFEPASVAVPLGATEPRPIVIALHGTADLAEWQCGTWRGIVGPRPFILCPRGVRRPGASGMYTFGPLEQTERELRAALKSLAARYGDYLAGGEVVLTGYSLGAIQAAHLSKQEPSFFARLVFVEGGHETWSSTLAALFAERGGKRVLFVCAQASCVETAQIKTRLSERAGVLARVADAGPIGHVFDGRVAAVVKQHWSWLVQDDARFGAPPPSAQ